MIAKSRSGRDVVKVLDFGIAKAMAGGDQTARAPASSWATPRYLSPEALSGDPVDGRSDLYAVGCIPHKLLSGEPCFPGTSAESMINRRLSEPPPRARVIVADLRVSSMRSPSARSRDRRPMRNEAGNLAAAGFVSCGSESDPECDSLLLLLVVLFHRLDVDRVHSQLRE